MIWCQTSFETNAELSKTPRSHKRRTGFRWTTCSVREIWVKMRSIDLYVLTKLAHHYAYCSGSSSDWLILKPAVLSIVAASGTQYTRNPLLSKIVVNWDKMVVLPPQGPPVITILVRSLLPRYFLREKFRTDFYNIININIIISC